MIVEKDIESKNLAKKYKELLRNSYQTLNDKDKKLIRLAFDTAVDAQVYSGALGNRGYCHLICRCLHFSSRCRCLHQLLVDLRVLAGVGYCR